jgi:hypothetical protein
MFGVMAYPAQGIYKSLKSLQQSKVEQVVASGRTAMMVEGMRGLSGVESAQIISQFYNITKWYRWDSSPDIGAFVRSENHYNIFVATGMWLLEHGLQNLVKNAISEANPIRPIGSRHESRILQDPNQMHK